MKIISFIWGLLSAWTLVSLFSGVFDFLTVLRIIAVVGILGLCIWRNTLPDVREWVILILAVLVIFLAWNVPWISIEVFLKNSTIREFTFYGSVILSLIMSDGEGE